MKLKIAVFITGILFLSANLTFSQSSASHTVTVTVTSINEMAISGGNLSLNISNSAGGSQPVVATDDVTCDLSWTTTEASKKITVATNLDSPSFPLKVVAKAVSGGNAASEVKLSTIAQDFITGIAKTIGNCNLGYSASVTAADGIGSEVHTVIYTLTDL